MQQAYAEHYESGNIREEIHSLLDIPRSGPFTGSAVRRLAARARPRTWANCYRTKNSRGFP
jgi:hypothetical protein